MRPIMFFLKCLNDHDEIDSLIKREIDCRTRFILCDSEKSRKSDWVKREVEYIKSKDRNFDVIDMTVNEDLILQQIEEIKKQATILFLIIGKSIILQNGYMKDCASMISMYGLI